MKLVQRLSLFCATIVALGCVFLGAAQPVLAGCVVQFDIDNITAYRDYIIIDFTYDNAASSPIEFTVSDGATQVGSGTFTSAVPGTFSIEFDLSAGVVQELDMLDIIGNPDLGCNAMAVATATGVYYLPSGLPAARILPQCPDGRINYNHCDKIAIFPIKDEGSFGINILVVDKKIVPEFAIFVPAADLAALPENPQTILTIATSQDGLVILYKHSNGDYQVNYGPDFEGKVFTFRFNGLPAAKYPEVTTFMVGALLPRFVPELS